MYYLFILLLLVPDDCCGLDTHNRTEHLPTVFVKCPHQDVYETHSKKCVPNSRCAHDLHKHVEFGEHKQELANLSDVFDVQVGDPCSAAYEWDDEWYLMQNGSISAGVTTFYLAPTWSESSLTVQYQVRICYEPESQTRIDMIHYCISISALFLSITFVIYAVLPELRNLHGKALMCFIMSMLNGHIFQLFIHFFVPNLHVWCTIIGHVMVFWQLSAFFWLNVISYHLWKTQRTINRPSNQDITFLRYCAYAWGVPALLVIGMHGFDRSSLLPKDLRPGFGVERCNYRPNMLIEFLYFYMIILTIILANSTFFALTALHIRRVQRNMVIVSQADSKVQKAQFEQRDTSKLFLRLLIVMGVTWILEILSWVLPESWWNSVPDVFNSLQGVFTFIIFGLRANTRKLLVKRWMKLRGRRQNVGDVTMTASTSEIKS